MSEELEECPECGADMCEGEELCESCVLLKKREEEREER